MLRVRAEDFTRRLPCHWHPGCVQRYRRCLTNRLKIRSIRRRRIRISAFFPHIGHASELEAAALYAEPTLIAGEEAFAVEWL